MTPTSWTLVAILAGLPLMLLVSRSARRHFALFLIVWLATFLALVAVQEPDIINCLRKGSLSC